ncbi:MAG: hypothetical protein VX460_14410 [Planctomycetota bacterium]|nr:hypothetical protein [Planctomycetota bacterium]
MSLAAVLLALPAVDPSAIAGAQETGAASASLSSSAQDDARWSRRELELLTRIADLETELRAAQERAIRQQQEWIDYVRVLQGFESVRLPEPPEFLAEAMRTKPDPAAEALARREALRRARSAEVGRRLQALLIADGVRGIDLLETGLLHERNGRSCVGPVVARLLDDRGRLVGMVRAEHLHLEVSRAARVVTVVLEDGFESRAGVRTPFPAPAGASSAETGAAGATAPAGVRRMAFPSVDPRPWIEAVPELVDRDDVDADLDDGTWDLPGLRVRLTQLLAASSPAGASSWRIAGLGGVRQRRLMDVQFVELDAAGQVRRRVFADVAEVRVPGSGSVEILLRDGSVKRGARVAPFLEGTYRIVLPFADAPTWRASEIPLVAR